MEKRTIGRLLAVFLCLFMSIAFLTACGSNNTEASDASDDDAEKTEVTDENHEHTYGAWHVVTATSCTQDGLAERTCTKCGDKEQRHETAFGHSFIDHWCERCGAEEAATEGLTFASTGTGAVIVTGYEGESESVYIATTHNGLPVTGLGAEAFAANDKAVEIEIGQSRTGNVFSIGTGAFKNNVTLETLIFSPSVKEVGKDAFLGCGALQSVRFTSDVNDWCGIEFDGEDASPANFASVYFNATKLGDELSLSGVYEIKKYTFCGFSQLKTIIFPASVKKIGIGAFYGCNSIENVDFKGNASAWCGIEYGDEYANPMYYAETLYCNNKVVSGEIYVPATVSVVPENAFKNCKIKAVYIADGVLGIGKNAFLGCENLTKVSIGNNVTEVGEGAFEGCPIQDLTAPAWVLTQFSVEELETLFLSAGTEVPERACYGLENLQKVEFADGFRIIGGSAFYGCRALTEVDLCEGLTGISYTAFSECSSLVSVQLPQSLLKIGYGAFCNCTSLRRINLPEGLATVGFQAFRNCPLDCSVYDNAKYIGNDENPYMLLVKATNDSITTCYVHPQTRWILDEAFSGCRSLASVDLGRDLVSVGQKAFYDCAALHTVVMGNNVETIDANAFERCVSLESLELSSALLSIGANAFLNCTGLTELTLGANITKISSRAFYAAQELAHIYYGGTVEQWQQLEKGADWDYGTPTYSVHCYGGGISK